MAVVELLEAIGGAPHDAGGHPEIRQPGRHLERVARPQRPDLADERRRSVRMVVARPVLRGGLARTGAVVVSLADEELEDALEH
jgi:hypothetical protein